MADFFEYNEQTDMDISVLLLLIKEKNLKFKTQIGYFVISAVNIIKQMFYGADIGPAVESLFKDESQELGLYLQDASRDQVFQVIRSMSWLFVAAFAVSNKTEATQIKAEGEKALGRLNICEQSYILIVNSPEFNLFTVFVEFNKICCLILKKKLKMSPTTGYIFCNVFSDLFLFAIANSVENKTSQTKKS